MQFHAPEEYGKFVSSDGESFTFYDIDLKADVTVRFEEVRKIKNGYGGYNTLSKTHTDRTRNIVFLAIIAGGLAVLIVAAGKS